MTFAIDATVRAKGVPARWMPILSTVTASSLAEARRRWINTLVLAGLEYGTLHITYTQE